MDSNVNEPSGIPSRREEFFMLWDEQNARLLRARGPAKYYTERETAAVYANNLNVDVRVIRLRDLEDAYRKQRYQ